MYVFVFINSDLENVDVSIYEASSDSVAIGYAFRDAINRKAEVGCVDFSIVEIWKLDDSLVCSLHFG